MSIKSKIERYSLNNKQSDILTKCKGFACIINAIENGRTHSNSEDIAIKQIEDICQ